MININGKLLSLDLASLSHSNRGLNYGDAIFETLKVVNGKILFWEDHYFRLMASMRVLRMEIPLTFTMEFLEQEIFKTIECNKQLEFPVRIKFFVYRESDGLYLPESNEIGFVVSTKIIDSAFYELRDDQPVVDLFKDHYILSGLLSNLKTNNRVINVLGSIYAKENNFQNCLLLNENKMVVEALNGNVFLIKGSTIKTPSLASGCIKGIMRKQVLDVLNALPDYEVIEGDISPFELQKADELWITNVIAGINPIGRYRKKNFTNTIAKDILGKINAKARLG